MVIDSAMRERLATCTRILAMQGLIGLYGHISAFDPDSGHVLLSPGAGFDKALTRPEDLLVLDLTGRVLQGTVRVPIEWPIHTAIHAARPDALSVAHLHAPYSTLFAIAKRELKPAALRAAMFGSSLPLYREANLVSTPALGKQLVEMLADHRAVLMRGHGSAVVGTSIEDMLYASLVLEDNARNTWQAATLGEIGEFSAEEISAHRADRGSNVASVWGYYTKLEARWDKQPGMNGNPLG